MSSGGVPGPVGNLNMDPAAASRALAGIQAPIDAWAAAWPARITEIHTAEMTVETGFDDLSVQFRNAYNQIAPELIAQVSAFAPRILRAVGTGRSIVAQHNATLQQVSDLLGPR
ncbi:hypothetical protein EV646_112284 [Kribbella antiqua]|uniref:PE family protein n=1 Tax=Kribbella antiqua TaxID=2512217 RepID=A0A4R2IHK2_9ACTN|nr:hypothetical protein [Kribbella antiqua]TCO43706.1 hypothetical protein EV646_112284 [Kribbella antiqua]